MNRETLPCSQLSTAKTGHRAWCALVSLLFKPACVIVKAYACKTLTSTSCALHDIEQVVGVDC